MKTKLTRFVLIFVFTVSNLLYSQKLPENPLAPRERLKMDFGWRFAFGHPYDTEKDFRHATGYFSYLTKSGYGDGPAAPDFDDSAWRVLDVPHDWAVEQPFSGKGSHSHGYKAIGRNFPEASVGWYRKHFFIPESDLGRRITIEFDGVHRDAVVWVNGFYLGRESSGYSNFRYDITDYLNYGGENVVVVRADVTVEEGWFYEGAGIYRHVWMTKTAPLHVDACGTFVTSEVKENSTEVSVQTTVVNEGKENSSFKIIQKIVDANGKSIAVNEINNLRLNGSEVKDFTCTITVPKPALWSIEAPNLYKLITQIEQNNSVIDTYETTFGIRTIRFDPNEGFFLNGKPVKLKGTNNHQDHAGVGTAIPDALQEFRIQRLKDMGNNAYRCSHNPPTPELLDACDRLGMLIMPENRLMGTTPEHYDRLKRMILRDRNHPSVFIWSIGNEEWAIEGNEKGARIAATMQSWVQQLDPTRRVTVASSGGWGQGVSTTIDVMGFNYISHGNTDEHHQNFPNQPGIGTEESTTQGTRGVYEDNWLMAHMKPTDRRQRGSRIERGWKYYAERPYLAGLFYWTGFDYRGESNPFNFPAVSSQYGILDLCGFPKDPFYYLKAWWEDEPVLHVMPHWNWPGKDGQEIIVWVHSNCDEVELLLNQKSLGRKTMEKNSHLEWTVNYEPGELLARGYKDGKEISTERVETTGEPAKIQLSVNHTSLKADGEDVVVVTVQVTDAKGRIVPTASQEINFSLKGPGKIIGVGNGDPSSHEPDKYFEKTELVLIRNLKILPVDRAENRPEVAFEFDDSGWKIFRRDRDEKPLPEGKEIIIRGEFYLNSFNEKSKVTLFTKSLSENQSVYVNGCKIAEGIERDAPGQMFVLDRTVFRPGKNVYAIVGPPLVKHQMWEELNTEPGIVQVVTPAKPWKRCLFNGLAQVIIQATDEAGEVVLSAESPGLKKAELKIQAKAASKSMTGSE